PPGLNATNRLLNTDRGFSRCSITSLQMTAFPSSYRTRTDYSLPISRRTAKESGHYHGKFSVPRYPRKKYAANPTRTPTVISPALVMMIAPHRGNRSKPPTQDRRRLSRYMRRWLVERFFAWIQWQRRILIRWEYHAHNFLGFVQLACLVILFKQF